MAVEVDSASNINEYQEFFWGVQSGRHVGLTTLYVCMYKGEPKTGPSTATFNDLLCFPFRLALD
jgi:hypothetical protein